MPVYIMRGPLRLTSYVIDSEVPAGIPGVFVLGRFGAAGRLTAVNFIGRADDLAGELKRHAGKAEAFLYERATSQMNAFEMECEIYHQFNPPGLPHPSRPAGMPWKCPSCRHFG